MFPLLFEWEREREDAGSENRTLREEKEESWRERIAVKCDVYGNFDLSYCTSDLRTVNALSLSLLPLSSCLIFLLFTLFPTVHLVCSSFTHFFLFTPKTNSLSLLYRLWHLKKLIALSMIPIIVIIIITIQSKGSISIRFLCALPLF